jgi:RND family efflux transporter MFP subunit
MTRARPLAAGVAVVVSVATTLVAAQSTSPTDVRPQPSGAQSVPASGSAASAASRGPATPASGTSPTSAAPRGEIDPRVIRAFAGTRAVTRPSRDAVMGFSLPTRVSEILVRGGQDVAKDQLMIRGDDVEDQAFLELQELRANSDVPVQAAKAAMDLADVEFQRIREAFEAGGSNQQEFDRARLTAERSRLDWEAAKEAQTQERVGLKARRARVEKLLLRAPFDGQIDSVMADVGQSVSEQDKIVRVVNVDPLWIDTPAPMSEVETLALKVGDPAWVLMGVAGVPRIVRATVIEVSPTTDLSSRSRRVRVEVPNPKGATRLIAGDESWTRFSEPTDEAGQLVIDAGGSAATGAAPVGLAPGKAE